MTEQKARKIIGKITLDRVNWEELEAINIAIKALEKQIPKEVSTMKYRNDYDWTCNNCDTTFKYIRYTADKSLYCPYCGQALKWE